MIRTSVVLGGGQRLSTARRGVRQCLYLLKDRRGVERRNCHRWDGGTIAAVAAEKAMASECINDIGLEHPKLSYAREVHWESNPPNIE